MGRLTTFINEKIEKREIEEALRSTDVKVGAEWEFKMNDSYFDYEIEEYRTNVEESEQYDEDYEKWEKEHEEWETDKEEVESAFEEEIMEKYGNELNNYQVDELRMEKIDDWILDNPEPEEPELPDNYISLWSRRNDTIDITESVPFEKRESALIDHMESDSNLRKYTGGGWEIHDDGSLQEGLGIELVSPPMKVKDFMECCPRIFDMIDKIGYTDKECGLHIGVSLTSGMDQVDPIKLAMFTDEGYFWKNFDGRGTNTYVTHMKEFIRTRMYEGLDKWSDKSPNKAVSELKRMIKKGKMEHYISPDHYHGVNIEHLDSNNPYIEFRYMGGQHYHKMWDTVKVVIAHYIYNLKLARDPNFKKKEYILKCNRVLLKLEKWVLMEELRKLKKDKDEWRNDPEDEDEDVWFNRMDDTKKKMVIRNLERRMSFLPTLSDKEIKILRRI